MYTAEDSPAMDSSLIDDEDEDDDEEDEEDGESKDAVADNEEIPIVPVDRTDLSEGLDGDEVNDTTPLLAKKDVSLVNRKPTTPAATSNKVAVATATATVVTDSNSKTASSDAVSVLVVCTGLNRLD